MKFLAYLFCVDSPKDILKHWHWIFLPISIIIHSTLWCVLPVAEPLPFGIPLLFSTFISNIWIAYRAAKYSIEEVE
jgi:hypothetical protein